MGQSIKMSWKERVSGAIASLKARGGSSLPAIKKALGAEQPQWRFINAALKSGVAKGVFTKNGGKYKVGKVKAAPKKKESQKEKSRQKKESNQKKEKESNQKKEKESYQKESRQKKEGYQKKEKEIKKKISVFF